MSRLIFSKVSPEGYTAVRGVETYLNDALDPVVHEIVKVRASMINGCAYCLDMHIAKLVQLDVPQRKINMIATWRETDFFSDTERAALALTEEVTEIGGGVYDETWQDVLDLFGEKGASDLVLAIAQINVWNRIQIATEVQPPKL